MYLLIGVQTLYYEHQQSYIISKDDLETWSNV